MLGAIDRDFTTLLPLTLATVISSQLKNKTPHRAAGAEVEPLKDDLKSTNESGNDMICEPQEVGSRTLTATSEAILVERIEDVGVEGKTDLIDDTVGLGFEMDLAAEIDEEFEDEFQNEEPDEIVETDRYADDADER